MGSVRLSKAYKKKKKKQKAIDDYNTWNRAQTTGLSVEELIREVSTSVAESFILTEIDLTVDHEKIALLKGKKHKRNLINIISKIIT